MPSRPMLADPTIKPSAVYQREVFAVRDGLSDAEKIEFDLLMPTQHTLTVLVHSSH